MSTRAYGEDAFGATRRGEATSRLETRLDGEAQEQKPRFESSAMEGLHAEDNPQLVKSIEAAQRMGQEDAAAAEAVRNEYLAAAADGSVRRLPGEPNARAIGGPQATPDNEWDRLKKQRLAAMQQRAAARNAWRDAGHGVYATLESEAAFLEALPKHPRCVCHLSQEGSLDSELLHHHMRALCEAHLETYFCRLDAAVAPVMLALVDLAKMPALLLCRDGKVEGQLLGVDRSFTTEGVAYELAQTGMLDFEDGTRYARTKGGCTADTAARAAGASVSDHDSDDLSD